MKPSIGEDTLYDLTECLARHLLVSARPELESFTYPLEDDSVVKDDWMIKARQVLQVCECYIGSLTVDDQDPDKGRCTTSFDRWRCILYTKHSGDHMVEHPRLGRCPMRW